MRSEERAPANFRILIRTGQLHQLEMAQLALRESGIPHYLQEEDISGMIVAMPIDPSPAPGVWWSILVPEDKLPFAEEIIESLPFTFTKEPDFWDCNPTSRVKRYLVIGAWVSLAVIVISILIQVISA